MSALLEPKGPSASGMREEHGKRDEVLLEICTTEYLNLALASDGSRAPALGPHLLDTAIQTGTSGSHVVEIQAVHEKRNLNDNIFTTKPKVKYSHCPQDVVELIVVEDEKSMIYPSRVHSRYTNVHIDYAFGPHEPKTFSLSNSTAPFRVRWFYNQAQRSWRHATRTTSLRGEREIEIFGRAYLEKYFTDEDMISLPMFLFADGFGLYRNMYRAIEGLYLIPQLYFLAVDREKLTSLIPLALGPFGSSKADIYKALNYICELEKGKPYKEDSPHDPKQFTASQWLVTATWKWSQSLLYVFEPYSSEVARFKLPEAILQGRAALSFLLAALSMAERQKPQRQNKATKLVRTLGLTGSFLSQTGSGVLQDAMNQYDKKIKRGVTREEIFGGRPTCTPSVELTRELDYDVKPSRIRRTPIPPGESSRRSLRQAKMESDDWSSSCMP
ncbi:hypothetical protein E4U51_003014 [Claviceps purpurea]|nr:hypothetical protein E4U51_003014 [Claviceps purpurea]